MRPPLSSRAASARAVWSRIIRVYLRVFWSVGPVLENPELLVILGFRDGILGLWTTRTALSIHVWVAYAGSLYSVPYRYGGRQVQLSLREEQALLEIWAEDTCLAMHPLLAGHGRQSLQPEPLSGLWRLTLQGKGQRPLPTPSPPPAREEATGPLHLPGVAAMPEVEVRPLTVYAALAEEVPVWHPPRNACRTICAA
jgi:hypothetical protein